MDPTTAALEKEHEAITKVKYIDKIQMVYFTYFNLIETLLNSTFVMIRVDMKLIHGTSVLTQKSTEKYPNSGSVNTVSNICA